MAVDISEISDGALVRRHLEGEEQAFEELFDRYYTRLFRFCLQRVGDRSASEDIAQDTLLQALKYLQGFDPKRPMWPWLKTIAGHLIGRFIGVKHEEQSLIETWVPSAASVHDAADLLGEKELLGLALKRLAPSQRNAISLRYLDEWSPKELAEFLGVGKHAVEQLLSRARVKLREEYRRLSSEGRERLGLVCPPLLVRVRNRFRQWAANLRGENGLVQAGASGAPLINQLLGLIAAGVAIVLLAAGSIHGPNASGAAAARQGQGHIGSPHAGIQDAGQRETIFKRSSRSVHISTDQMVGGAPGSASGSVEVKKNSLRARLEAKTPGDHHIIVPVWIETNAECDYSAVQQALCEMVDRLPDQD